MAATFVRMPLELGKRKSAEIIGIFLQSQLDWMGRFGVSSGFCDKF
jgi:hypothetical protein